MIILISESITELCFVNIVCTFFFFFSSLPSFSHPHSFCPNSLHGIKKTQNCRRKAQYYASLMTFGNHGINVYPPQSETILEFLELAWESGLLGKRSWERPGELTVGLCIIVINYLFFQVQGWCRFYHSPTPQTTAIATSTSDHQESHARENRWQKLPNGSKSIVKFSVCVRNKWASRKVNQESGATEPLGGAVG